MLTVSNLSLQFGKRVLFDDVNIKFTQGNCYGVIGANGSGKSTFLKILAGEIDPNTGGVTQNPGTRMAVLSQDHFKYNEETVMNTVIMGHKEMYDIMLEKDAIYMNPEATEEDGLKAAELENTFGEMGGWVAESDAAELLSLLGVKVSLHYQLMADVSGPDKIKILLAQALFGNPDILVLDEPTNDLDARGVTWLADFLAGFKNTVIVVSHDRYFLDMICTHVADIDFNKIQVYTGNYTFWYESSQLLIKQRQDKNKKTEQKRKELMDFVARFSANAAKSKQATSRKKALEKLQLDQIKISSRKYPFIKFKPDRKPGSNIIEVEKLSKKAPNGEMLFSDITFEMNKGDKVILMSHEATAVTAFFQVLMGQLKPDSGTFKFGQSITYDDLPLDNSSYFAGENDLDLVNWLRQFSGNSEEEKDEQFIRGFFGRMLFKGEEVLKQVSVLSGGEKVRCMLSKMMLRHPNLLLLDEPTNHLDLESITALDTALKDFEGNIIMSSHDHKLCQTIGNRIIEITPNGIIDSLLDFDDYLTSERILNLRRELYGAENVR